MSVESHDVYTGSNEFGIVVDHYGDARGTKSQFEKSDPSRIDPLIYENIAAYHFATEALASGLSRIRTALENCWTGNSADNALSILTSLSTDATTIGTNTLACHDSFVTFQASWTQLKSQADSLYEGVGGSGVHEDNNGAHSVFKQFTDAMQTSMHSMPSHLRYGTPLSDQSGSSPGGPGPTGSGPGPVGPGPVGPGPVGPGPHGPGPVGPGPVGPGPTRYTTTPVFAHPGSGSGSGSGPGPGPGPGFGGGPGPGSGATYHGGNGGYPPGSGLDTGAQLAGYNGPGGPGGPGFSGPGPGFGGPGPGPGFAGPGPGFAGPGAAFTGALGASGALDAEAGVSGVGAGQANAGVRPMMGRGGAGGDDDDERDRTTWLSEEEGIWDGETTAPPGIIA